MSGIPGDEPIRIPITDELDLHTFQPGEIKSIVNEYISECRKTGILRVRIIHGKGKSVQKHNVRSLLEKHAGVASFKEAAPESGGWGATIAHLNP